MNQDAEQPIVEARKICRRHPDGSRWLLHDISLAVTPGDRIALVGPSGAGKTLLLRSLVLLDPVDQGEVRWNGRPVPADETPSFRCQVMYVHQRPAFARETVEDVIQFPFTLHVHRDRAFDRDVIIRLLERLGRDPSFLEKRVRDLSGGEMQITSLIRAIQLEPSLLLLDEPAAALDAATSRAFETLILDWCRGKPDERAFVFVGHAADQAKRLTQKQITMQDGTIVED